MPLWLRREAAVRHPYAIDAMLVSTGLARSLTEARRMIADGGICLNNEKLIPPEEGFLPVAIIDGSMRLDEYIALGADRIET